MPTFDTSKELIISPYNQGVRLLRPQYSKPHAFSVNDVLDFPCNTYFMTANSEVANINDNSARNCGYDHARDALGRTAFDTLAYQDAINIVNGDLQVMQSKRIKLMDDAVIHPVDGSMMRFITIKLPVFNDDHQVAGVFGFSINLSEHSVASSIESIAKLGILNFQNSRLKNALQFMPAEPRAINNIHFTKREMDIIYYIMRGKTMKEIGLILGISHRTVENNFDRIKQKAGVRTKSKFIEEFIKNI